MHGLTLESPPNEAFSLVASTAEDDYTRAVGIAHRREYGQFFTPPKLAQLMADWVMGINPLTVLDPAFGTGILTAACMEKDTNASFLGYEKDPVILQHARQCGRQLSLKQEDFLSAEIECHFDAVVMNPPYIRHREITGYEEERAMIGAMSGISIPKSANLYIYFAVKSLALLEPGGRAAILIPGEWMSANFSGSFKRFLLESRLLKQAILFSNCSNVFDDALTTASVLLCEK